MIYLDNSIDDHGWSYDSLFKGCMKRWCIVPFFRCDSISKVVAFVRLSWTRRILNWPNKNFMQMWAVVSGSRCAAESCLVLSVISSARTARDKSQISPNMSSSHIFTLLLLTSLVAAHPPSSAASTSSLPSQPQPPPQPLTSLMAAHPPSSTTSHSLTCLPSSSSIEVPSDGELLNVQCNVTVPKTQVWFSVLFFSLSNQT